MNTLTISESPKSSRLKSCEKLCAAFAASFIPFAVYLMAHSEGVSIASWYGRTVYAIVAGGLCYSAPSVAQWAAGWTRSMPKAIGFTVLLEGVLVFAPMRWLSIMALVILAGINCVVAVVRIGASVRAFAPAKRRIAKRAAKL